jgi:endoglucanase
MNLPSAIYSRLVQAAGLFICCLLSADRLSAEEPGLPELKVTGNHLTIPSGAGVRLHGVNIPSLEWSQGDHLSNSVDVASAWGANIIRLPLSEDRWFGHTPEKQDGGAQYRQTVTNFVENAAAKKCYVILDLHWSDGGVWGEHIGQHYMPDDNSVPFWKEVSAAFANNPAVLFDLYNEPHDISWDVWRNGGVVVDETSKANDGQTLRYHTPGMQKLLDICRDQGARNVIVAGGLDWAYDLRGVVDGHALDDPKGNGVVYSTHIYPMKTWYTHGTTKSQDWDRLIVPVSEKYPVIVGEFGSSTTNYAGKVVEFANQNNLSWIAWCLHPYARPILIRDWDYTPTKYGTIIKDALHSAAVAAQ